MNYWQVKAAALEWELRKVQFQTQVKDAEAAYARVMTENGLDPAKSYRMLDNDESVTEVPTDGTPA